MKICFLIGAMRKGGAERVISNLSNYLINNNEIDIIVFSNDNVEYFLNEKINVVKLVERESKLKILKNIKRLIEFKKVLKERNPDRIVAFFPVQAFISIITNLFSNIPIIVSVRNDPKVEYKKMRNKIMMKLFFWRVNGFVFQTEEAQKYFSKKIQKKSVIIANSIDNSFFIESYQGDREKIIVNVGRLEKQKNQELLIESFSKLDERFNDYILEFYGEGSLRNRLQEIINTKKMEKRIFLRGKCENVKEKIYKSSLFVLSSDFEGMPNALMEAMVMGIPVISTDCPCGGPRYLIENEKNGILTPVGDTELLKKCMEKVLANKNFSKQMGIEANKIYERINPKVINNEWEKYIKNVKGEGNNECIRKEYL